MQLRANQVLYRQGDVADSLYVIKSGKIGLYVKGPSGPVEVARLRRGQIVGDLSFFTGSPRTSDAIALADTEFTAVSYESVRAQFETIPAWIKSVTMTLASQVQSYSTEIKPLRDHKDVTTNDSVPRLVIARAWAALTLVPSQFGVRDGETVSIDWPTLRSYSNLCFREISERVIQLASALAPLGFCSVHADANGPTAVVLNQPKLFTDFLAFYRKAIIENKSELDSVRAEEYATMHVLADPRLGAKPIHRGQVEVDLSRFKEYAESLGHPEVTATSVDLLNTYGIEVTKSTTDTGVKIRFHQHEVVNHAKFWQILRAIQDMTDLQKVSNAA